jgi:hypothetical protein
MIGASSSPPTAVLSHHGEVPAGQGAARGGGRAFREYHRLHPNATRTAMRKIQDPYPFQVNGYEADWLEKYRSLWSQLTATGEDP